MRKLTIALAVMLTLMPQIAEAARFICGATARHEFGFPPRYRGCNLNLAREWARCFARTHAKPGAVVVSARRGKALGGGPGGHVAVVKQVIDSCHAIVRDEKGTYKRNVCKNFIAFVDPHVPVG